MKCKKISERFFASLISCMLVFPAFACSDGEDSGNKEVLVLESEKITMTEFSKPVSLLPWCVSQYLAADPEELVTSYLLAGSTRYDKGEPVRIEYSFSGLENAEIVEEKLEVSTKEDFSSIEQTLNFSSRLSYVDIYNLQTGTTYYYRVVISLDNGEKHVKTSSFQTQESVRFISLDGACNVRDIGGWSTESGKTIKQGLLYRGSETAERIKVIPIFA